MAFLKARRIVLLDLKEVGQPGHHATHQCSPKHCCECSDRSQRPDGRLSEPVGLGFSGLSCHPGNKVP